MGFRSTLFRVPTARFDELVTSLEGALTQRSVEPMRRFLPADAPLPEVVEKTRGLWWWKRTVTTFEPPASEVLWWMLRTQPTLEVDRTWVELVNIVGKRDAFRLTACATAPSGPINDSWLDEWPVEVVPSEQVAVLRAVLTDLVDGREAAVFREVIVEMIDFLKATSEQELICIFTS